jgi:hypothetical protein
MSPSAAKGKKRPASPVASEPTIDLPNSPPTSPDKKIKIEPSAGPPQYNSVAEAMRAQHKLYANFEDIGKTPKADINLKVTAGTTSYRVSIANKRTFFIVGPLDEHDMSVGLPTV